MTVGEKSSTTENIETATAQGKIYFPDLDGWRFVAFIAVFYFHSFHTEISAIKDSTEYVFIKGLVKNGNLGVDFFFVLSGFLIIYLLISEQYQTGGIGVKGFYVRRILRIFPLYYFCVFFSFVLFPTFKHMFGQVPNETADWRYYIFFLGNIDTIYKEVLPDSGTLGVLWSVSVEEQFYLTIPLVLLIMPVRFYPALFSAVIGLSIVFRAIHADNYWYLSMHTFSFAGNLALGGLIAYFSFYSFRFKSLFENLHPFYIVILYLVTIAIFLFRDQIFFTQALSIFSTIIIAACFAAIILEQNYSRRSISRCVTTRYFLFSASMPTDCIACICSQL